MKTGRCCLGLLVVLGAGGCASVYKDSLCRLSESSVGVANHYEAYVEAERDAATKEARRAEAKQFRGAIEEGRRQCAQ